MISSSYDYEEIFMRCALGAMSIGSGAVLLSRIDSMHRDVWVNIGKTGIVSCVLSVIAAAVSKNGVLSTLDDLITTFAQRRIGEIMIPSRRY